MSDVVRVDVDESPDPVAWLDVAAAPDMLGALWGLYYAIYYGDAEQFGKLPTSVMKAYGRVQGALNV